jgi:hypothetical protein
MHRSSISNPNFHLTPPLRFADNKSHSNLGAFHMILKSSAMRPLLFLSICFTTISSAQACFNDRGVAKAEKEFRSRYESSQVVEKPASNRFSTWGVIGLSAGSGIVAGCIVVQKRRGKDN